MEREIGDWRIVPGETPVDPSHLKDRSITTRPELCRAEALNIRKAYVKYLAAVPTKRLAPFDDAWFLRLHHEMFCDVWLWAGRLRQVDFGIGQVGIPWPQVSQQVHALTLDLPCWVDSDMSLLEQAARLHYRAVWIHPFINGNGRWARLLSNIWLRLHEARIVIWPEESIGEESPIWNSYLKALQDADNGDFGRLLALHERHVER
jgi:fido (protein-threonine AMPylation protein)